LGENQIPICKQLDAAGVAFYAGPISEFRPHKFVKLLEDFSDALQTRFLEIENFGEPIDCLGAKRIAELLSPSSKEQLVTRRAQASDMLLYYGWANDPLVREQSINHDFIGFSDHKRWFGESISHQDSRFLVFEVQSLPIAQVRFQKKKDNWELSYSLDEIVRGRGWATTILTRAVNWILSSETVPIITARVKTSNIASKRTLLKSGFSYSTTSENGKIEYFSLHNLNC
jgi:RimJ/RimL family protein N-acetyltransferase